MYSPLTLPNDDPGCAGVLVFSLSIVTQSRPTGVHEWLRVAAIGTAVSETDVFASTTGHSNIIDLVHMEMLIDGNTGHFDEEIDLAGSEGFGDNIKPQLFYSSSR